MIKKFFSALLFFAALMYASGGQAAAQPRARSMLNLAAYPLVGDDGESVANHPVKLPGPIDRLPGVVTVGNPHANTTLIEFYDLNCPFCRAASVDIGDLVDTDPQLKLVLVPYPVLGSASIAASRIELAVAKLGTPQQFYDFHRSVYAQRGIIDGPRALLLAHELGFDESALTAIGNSDETTQTMKMHFILGNALGLNATPAFIVGSTAIIGYPGRRALWSIVDAAGACGKVMC